MRRAPLVRSLAVRLAARGRPGHTQVGMQPTLLGLAARGFAPACVLDVGAAAGTWTELALSHWPAARYVLVEPLAERSTQLSQLAQEHPSLTWISAAAARSGGTVELNVAADLWGSSVLYEGVERRQVEAVAVDDLLTDGRLPQPQLMKLDVQGFELEVLAGAQQAMRGCELILLELRLFRGRPGMPMLLDALSWMAERDYRAYEIADVLRRPLDGAMAQVDVLFAREGSALLAVEGWA